MILMQMQAQLQQSLVLPPPQQVEMHKQLFQVTLKQLQVQYGTLTINSNGSYSYVANSNISGLDAGDSNITDVFTYIVSDGTENDTATLTINIIASQDLTARNDTGTVNEDATLTVANDGDDLTPVTPATFNSTLSPFLFALKIYNPWKQGFTFNNDGTKMFALDWN